MWRCPCFLTPITTPRHPHKNNNIYIYIFDEIESLKLEHTYIAASFIQSFHSKLTSEWMLLKILVYLNRSRKSICIYFNQIHAIYPNNLRHVVIFIVFRITCERLCYLYARVCVYECAPLLLNQTKNQIQIESLASFCVSYFSKWNMFLLCWLNIYGLKIFGIEL